MIVTQKNNTKKKYLTEFNYGVVPHNENMLLYLYASTFCGMN